MVQRHVLKIEAKYAKEVLNGNKSFEIRYNDRDFQVNDIVVFQVVDDDMLDFEIAHHVYRIDYITSFAQINGYVVFTIRDILEV